jgi:hypothetical protein
VRDNRHVTHLRPAGVDIAPSTVASVADAAATARTAFVAGMVGSLGDELLAVLLASSSYRQIHVAVAQPIGSTTSRFVPWPPQSLFPAVDAAFLCVTGADAFVPRDSVMTPLAAEEVPALAQAARAAGIRQLVLVSPLAALLQLGATAQAITDAMEMDLVQLNFERLMIVRPTAADRIRGPGGWRGVFRWAGRAVLEIMLPSSLRFLSARTAARAIVAAADAAKPGVTVLGARDLSAIVDQMFPAEKPKRRSG